MSTITVLTFDNLDETGQVCSALKKIEHGGYLSLDDSAVLSCDKENKLYIHGELDSGMKVGAVGGGL